MVKKHPLLRKNGRLSILCPEPKFRIPNDKVQDTEDLPGTRTVVVDDIEFRISFVAPKEPRDADDPLTASEFSLYRAVHGKAGERFYVIARVTAMDFAEDEISVGGATYVFLKIPLSVLLRLIDHDKPSAFEQPMWEEDVNEVIDAVGFDFISQPLVEWSTKKERSRLMRELNA